MFAFAVFALLHVRIVEFAEEIAGRNVIVWSDNTGAESATRKGGKQPLGTLHAPRTLKLSCAARRNKKLRPELLGSRNLEEIGGAGHLCVDSEGADEG